MTNVPSDLYLPRISWNAKIYFSLANSRRYPSRRLDGYLRELANEKYIFAFQDIRGRYKSEGTFVMQRNPRKDQKRIDESTDTYDTIDWLVKNVPRNNGRV